MSAELAEAIKDISITLGFFAFLLGILYLAIKYQEININNKGIDFPPHISTWKMGGNSNDNESNDKKVG